MLVPVGGRDECIVSVLDHVRYQNRGKPWEDTWRYHCMELICHLPTNMIMPILVRVMSSAMSLPVRMERMLTSSGVNPTCGPMTLAADWISLMILVLLTDVTCCVGRLPTGGFGHWICSVEDIPYDTGWMSLQMPWDF